MTRHGHTLVVKPGLAMVGGIKFPVYCEIVWDPTKKALSITGVIGPYSGDDGGGCAGTAGQILDAIDPDNGSTPIVAYAPNWDKDKLAAFLAFWDEYHLNDLVPYCEHQKALRWHKRKLDPNGPWVQRNMAQWSTPDEHPQGVLTKPCPICGYKYGTEWKTTTVPQEVIEWLLDLPPAPEVPPWV